MVGRRDAVTFFIAVYTVAHSYNLAANLVAQYQRRPVKAVPFHHIAATDTTGFNTYQ
jgi:hypothetical protein